MAGTGTLAETVDREAVDHRVVIVGVENGDRLVDVIDHDKEVSARREECETRNAERDEFRIENGSIRIEVVDDTILPGARVEGVRRDIVGQTAFTEGQAQLGQMLLPVGTLVTGSSS